MKRQTYIPIALLASLVLAGCHRRPLEDELFTTVPVPVKIHWDLAGISPKNATVLFYREDGSLYQEWKTVSQKDFAEGTAELEAGSYTAVVFNELRDQIDYIQMQGWENLATLGAYVRENPVPIYPFATFAREASRVHEPGVLAACIQTITITPEMINRIRYSASAPGDVAIPAGFYALTDLHPTRKTAKARIVVHAERLCNARMPAVGELYNMASGYLFATDRNTLGPVKVQFRINNRTYDPDSTRDGTISAVVSIFGVPGERDRITDTPDTRFRLDMAFMLTDAEQTIIETTTDVTNRMQITTDATAAVTIDIDIEAEPLPEIKPVGGDSGLTSDLIDWDKVIVPLK